MRNKPQKSISKFVIIIEVFCCWHALFVVKNFWLIDRLQREMQQHSYGEFEQKKLKI